ncbi:hypothetical protein T09_15695 [Trichinella sp. T9]|nr:hypothetical protein T09_15695 [Trichinella sp. T9]
MLSHLVPHYQKMSTFTFSDNIADNLLEPSEQVAQTNKSLQTLKNGKLTFTTNLCSSKEAKRSKYRFE